MTDQTNTEERAAEILENLEADGIGFEAQLTVLIDAIGIELGRLPEYRRAEIADNLAALVRSLAGGGCWWPTPSREAFQGAMDKALGELGPDGVHVAGYDPETRLPFVVVLNGEGELVRASTGKPRTEAEQAEAERQATRTLRTEMGLRLVDGDDEQQIH